MAKQPESGLQRRIRKKLEREVGGKWFKVHGSVFQESGITDLIGCVEGLYFAIEVKRPGKLKTTSDIQMSFMGEIADAGGHAEVVTNAKEAVEFVESVLATTTTPTRSGHVLRISGKRGFVVRSAFGKNVDQLRRDRKNKARANSSRRTSRK